MKPDTLKELGKFGFDLAKIVFAVAILPTVLKNGTINSFALIGALALTISGIMLINNGVNNE